MSALAFSKSSTLKFYFLRTLFSLLFLFFLSKAQADRPSEKNKYGTLQFPSDRSIGVLYSGKDSNHRYADARGKVLVPKDEIISLHVSEQEKDLSFLKNGGDTHLIKKLVLSETKISNQTLENLKYIPLLSILDLSETLISDEGIVHLAHLKKLEELHIGGFREYGQITGKSIACIARHLPQIENLSIISIALNKDDVRELVKLSHLRTLYLVGAGGVKGADIVVLQKIKALRDLTLVEIEDLKVEHLSGFNQLKELTLYNIYNFLSSPDNPSEEGAPGKATPDLKRLRKALPKCKVNGFRMAYC